MGGPEDGPASAAVSKLVKSGETRQIGAWSTVRYDMTIELGDDMSSYRAFVEAMADSQEMDWMRSFLEIEGYPVRQEFRMGPILSWQQLVSVSQEPAPAGTYEPPAGFKRVD
jgi:hypothetical protein